MAVKNSLGEGSRDRPREVDVALITRAVAQLCQIATQRLPADVRAALQQAQQDEASPTGQEILEQVLENADLAAQQRLPMCQDTGLMVVWVDVGQDVHLVGGTLTEAVDEGVRQGSATGLLRRSVVGDPLARRNTGDNTPPILHCRLVPGERVRVTVQPKGAGAENMSRLQMLTPADGVEGVTRFVVETVRQAGPNACPPLVVGVGIGGTMERAALLAKWALLRPVGQLHPQQEVAQLERELRERINRLGIGPQGLGGRVTALAVHVELSATHIACLPVAVNLQCHADRHASAEI